ncbi:hypothetical protein NPIL_134761 [Nephila pilipes]|uniref:Uncharacterized protein n=1 Tax=Nephila pilipes TaxID=299642 RepID=A0A8X6UFR9_NEPPI|nr:hypothetical protein NPIL_134761 [Nephila pilipes]
MTTVRNESFRPLTSEAPRLINRWTITRVSILRFRSGDLEETILLIQARQETLSDVSTSGWITRHVIRFKRLWLQANLLRSAQNYWRSGITQFNLAVNSKPLTIQGKGKRFRLVKLKKLGFIVPFSPKSPRHSCGTKTNETRSHELILWPLLREIRLWGERS